MATGAAAHADWTIRPSSARFAGTFSQWEKENGAIPLPLGGVIYVTKQPEQFTDSSGQAGAEFRMAPEMAAAEAEIVELSRGRLDGVKGRKRLHHALCNLQKVLHRADQWFAFPEHPGRHH